MVSMTFRDLLSKEQLLCRSLVEGLRHHDDPRSTTWCLPIAIYLAGLSVNRRTTTESASL